METGVLNRDNLNNLFRSFSQKRKSGVVSIQSEDSSFEIILESGRIVEVLEIGWFSSPAIYERLRVSGRLFGGVLDFEILSHMDLSTLYSNLVDPEYVMHADFMMARRALAVDMLRSLYFFSKGVFKFDPKMTSFDARLSLMLSPSQLLLDFAEFEANEVRYNEFLSKSSDRSLGVSSEGISQYYALQETELLRSIGMGGGLEEVVCRVLLSENDCRMALLSLYDRGAIFLYPWDPASPSELTKLGQSTCAKSVALVRDTTTTYVTMCMVAGVLAGIAFILPLHLDSFLGGVNSLIRVLK